MAAHAGRTMLGLKSHAKLGQGSSGQNATTATMRAALLLAAGLGLLSVRQAFVAQAGGACRCCSHLFRARD